MVSFVGRTKELASLSRLLDRVERAGPGDDEPGRCVLVRGRRRVGKSRLVEELCRRANVPSVYFTASKQGALEPGLFAEEVASSSLPGRDLVAGAAPSTWDASLRLLAAALDDGDGPVIVVVDEFPYLMADDPSVEAVFQKQWDRQLSKRRVLLVLVGSDLAMMESLNTYGRAFYQRGTELVVPPLSPAETGAIVGADDAADAVDAYLVSGGLPLVCAEWPTGGSLWDYLEDALGEPTSALIVSAERALAAEFPDASLARTVLGRIGAGERTFSNIARASGGLQAASLSRALDLLATARVVAKELPLSTRPSREARYRVADSYLRFWLHFVDPYLAEIERGRGDLVIDRVRRGWSTWRGRAVEPVVREALVRLVPLGDLPATAAVGAYWTRTNDPEVDLIGADRSPVAGNVVWAGSVKWLEAAPLDQADVHHLAAQVARVPGGSASTPLIGVSRSGVVARGLAAALGPDELLDAW